jgi:hypothetical protein
MMREMKTYKREKLLLQITELHQHIHAKYCVGRPRNDTKIFCILI